MLYLYQNFLSSTSPVGVGIQSFKLEEHPSLDIIYDYVWFLKI